MTHKQNITNEYALYNADCMDVLASMPDKSIDLSVYSPPFHDLYTYSSSPRDLSNCSSLAQFVEQYGFIVEELARVTKPGRINAVHCTDICKTNGTLTDFPHQIIKLYQSNGFELKGRITVWKEPLKVRIRTMVQSLMHKYIVEDSTKCFPSNPDYILIFKRKGENEVPVRHDRGLSYYAGDRPILPNMLTAWNNANASNISESELWEYLNKKYKNWDDPKTNKLSHSIWQRYASSLWDDVRDSHVLEYKRSKEEEDEKHVTPTQLDVIDRLVILYSNEGEVIFTPFSGIGTEVYSAVSLKRKGIGSELKTSYFNQSLINMKSAISRFSEVEQVTLF